MLHRILLEKKKAGNVPTEKQKTSMGKEQQDGRNWLKETSWQELIFKRCTKETEHTTESCDGHAHTNRPQTTCTDMAVSVVNPLSPNIHKQIL